MQGFQYETLCGDDFALQLKQAGKLLFQRPLFSFLPFILITTLLVMAQYWVSTRFATNTALIMAAFIMPLIALEMTYSNDQSTIPFRNQSLTRNASLHTYYLTWFITVMTILALMLASNIIGTVAEWLFPQTSSENMPAITQESWNEPPFRVLMNILIGFTASCFCYVAYILTFIIMLAVLPTRLHDINHSKCLLSQSSDALIANIYALNLRIMPLSFANGATILFMPDWIIVHIITWAIFTSYGLSLLYLMGKQMCGGGSKLAEKQSLIARLFQKPQVSVASQ
jgi:hypothetical protein